MKGHGRGHRPSCSVPWHYGLCAALMLHASVAAEMPAPRSPVGVTAVDVMVEHLRSTHAVERLQFAAVALDELVQAYRAELGTKALARGGDPGSVARWRGAVNDEIAYLERLANRLLTTADVIILKEPGPVLRLVIGVESVLIDAPRVSEPLALAARLIERYCARRTCPENTFRRQGSVQTWASWSFSDHAPPLLDTSSGLAFRFADTARLRARQDAAIEMIDALERAAAALQWHRAQGVTVDWDSFHLARLPANGTTVIVVNGAGEYLPLDLSWREFPQAALIRWFRARLEGGERRQLIEDAEAVLELAP